MTARRAETPAEHARRLGLAKAHWRAAGCPDAGPEVDDLIGVMLDDPDCPLNRPELYDDDPDEARVNSAGRQAVAELLADPACPLNRPELYDDDPDEARVHPAGRRMSAELEAIVRTQREDRG